MRVIVCSELVKSYRDRKVLDHVSFSIEENTITGLVGRNGAGKTTLLKILAGLLKKSQGDIHVFKEYPFNSLNVSANTVYIDNQMPFPATLTLSDILQQGQHFYENWDMNFARRLFDYFSFEPNEFYENLSKGKKSTFQIIFGLATRCQLTLLDEPTTGMDQATRNDFYRVLLRDYLEYPRTIIISSHHLDEIENLLEYVLLIDEGKIVFHHSIDELKEYAIGFSGNTALLMQWVQGMDILYQENDSHDSSYVVIKNNLPEKKLGQAKKLGIKTLRVTPSELCLYMTNKEKGGIDDVLHYS